MAVVLIADDEPGLRLLVQAVLEAHGHTVIEAANGEEAWRLLQECRPAIAVLDVSMPYRSGLDLTRTIRATPDLAATKVILLTGLAQRRDVDAGRDVGADAYMTKPFLPAKLAETVRRLLNGPHDPRPLPSCA